MCIESLQNHAMVEEALRVSVCSEERFDTVLRRTAGVINMFNSSHSIVYLFHQIKTIMMSIHFTGHKIGGLT